jgi:acyl-coenzyme A synthetase/AMP-(fatty) acid ligase
VDCVPVAATDPLYILYTSGTTGLPKGVVRDNGGHMVALKWSMKNIYGIEPGEVYWSASDVGWVVGHSYIVYAPLLHGATTILFEGKPVGTPDAGTFWRVIAEHKVVALFTAPTAFRAIKKEDPKADSSPNTICRTSAPCSSPASGPTPTRSSGPSASSACPSSTTGGRPRPAGRSPPIRWGWGSCRSNTARPPCHAGL